VALRPVRRRSVPDDVFDQLATDIVAGDLEAGAALPSERRLAEELGVSRPAVREALQRLSHAGLIEVRQGGVTTVRDFRRTAGLDLLPQLLAGGGEPDLDVVRSILEVRAETAPNIARRCAERRDDALVGELEAAVEQMAGQREDLASLQLTAHELWHRIVDGTDNMVDRLLFNALSTAYLPAMELLTDVLADEIADLDGYRELVEAIAARDGARAHAAAEQIVGKGTARGMDVLARLR
jgi:GntR family transcriptional regulator, transcriptional repressor for pyruvate dehydrogenase complex